MRNANWTRGMQTWNWGMQLGNRGCKSKIEECKYLGSAPPPRSFGGGELKNWDKRHGRMKLEGGKCKFTPFSPWVGGGAGIFELLCRSLWESMVESNLSENPPEGKKLVPLSVFFCLQAPFWEDIFWIFWWSGNRKKSLRFEICSWKSTREKTNVETTCLEKYGLWLRDD